MQQLFGGIVENTAKATLADCKEHPEIFKQVKMYQLHFHSTECQKQKIVGAGFLMVDTFQITLSMQSHFHQILVWTKSQRY